MGIEEIGKFGDKTTQVVEEITRVVYQGDRLKEALARTKLMAILKDRNFLATNVSHSMDSREGYKHFFLSPSCHGHRTNNHIKGLYNPLGIWLSSCDDIGQVLVDHFRNMLTFRLMTLVSLLLS